MREGAMEEADWITPVSDEQIAAAKKIVRGVDLRLVKNGETPLALEKTPEEIEAEGIRRALEN